MIVALICVFCDNSVILSVISRFRFVIMITHCHDNLFSMVIMIVREFTWRDSSVFQLLWSDIAHYDVIIQCTSYYNVSTVRSYELWMKDSGDSLCVCIIFILFKWTPFSNRGSRTYCIYRIYIVAISIIEFLYTRKYIHMLKYNHRT